MLKILISGSLFLILISSFGQKAEYSRFDSSSQINSSICIKALTYSKEINKYNFDKSAFDSLAIYLLENKSVYIEVSCFSDFTDMPLINLMATKEQANEIRYYLVKKGVEGSRIATLGNGDMFPLYNEFELENMSIDEKNAANLANRRIEIKIIKKG